MASTTTSSTHTNNNKHQMTTPIFPDKINQDITSNTKNRTHNSNHNTNNTKLSNSQTHNNNNSIASSNSAATDKGNSNNTNNNSNSNLSKLPTTTVIHKKNSSSTLSNLMRNKSLSNTCSHKSSNFDTMSVSSGYSSGGKSNLSSTTISNKSNLSNTRTLSSSSSSVWRRPYNSGSSSNIKTDQAYYGLRSGNIMIHNQMTPRSNHNSGHSGQSYQSELTNSATKRNSSPAPSIMSNISYSSEDSRKEKVKIIKLDKSGHPKCSHAEAILNSDKNFKPVPCSLNNCLKKKDETQDKDFKIKAPKEIPKHVNKNESSQNTNKNNNSNNTSNSNTSSNTKTTHHTSYHTSNTISSSNINTITSLNTTNILQSKRIRYDKYKNYSGITNPNLINSNSSGNENSHGKRPGSPIKNHSYDNNKSRKRPKLKLHKMIKSREKYCRSSLPESPPPLQATDSISNCSFQSPTNLSRHPSGRSKSPSASIISLDLYAQQQKPSTLIDRSNIPVSNVDTWGFVSEEIKINADRVEPSPIKNNSDAMCDISQDTNQFISPNLQGNSNSPVSRNNSNVHPHSQNNVNVLSKNMCSNSNHPDNSVTSSAAQQSQESNPGYGTLHHHNLRNHSHSHHHQNNHNSNNNNNHHHSKIPFSRGNSKDSDLKIKQENDIKNQINTVTSELKDSSITPYYLRSKSKRNNSQDETILHNNNNSKNVSKSSTNYKPVTQQTNQQTTKFFYNTRNKQHDNKISRDNANVSALPSQANDQMEVTESDEKFNGISEENSISAQSFQHSSSNSHLNKLQIMTKIPEQKPREKVYQYVTQHTNRISPYYNLENVTNNCFDSIHEKTNASHQKINMPHQMITDCDGDLTNDRFRNNKTPDGNLIHYQLSRDFVTTRALKAKIHNSLQHNPNQIHTCTSLGLQHDSSASSASDTEDEDLDKFGEIDLEQIESHAAQSNR